MPLSNLNNCLDRDKLGSLRKRVRDISLKTKNPFFVYDLAALESNLLTIRQTMPSFVKLWYACKANPHLPILEKFQERGWGLDVASLGELGQGTKANFSPKNIIATGPAKTKEYLQILLRSGVRTIVVESINQLMDLFELSSILNIRPKVLLRVQLSWEKGSSVLGGDQITPFGLSPNDWKQIDFTHFTKYIDIVGLHLFQWGNILSHDKLKQIWTKSAKCLGDLAKEIGIEHPILDFGGGLGIPYTHDQLPLDLKQVTSTLEEIKHQYNLKEIWLELGRYAVGECGFYSTPIVDRKTVRGRELLVLAGGINHLARPALTNQSFPCSSLNAKSVSTLSTFYLHGPLCTALDFMGKHSLPSNLTPGDWLVFSMVGAYGATESMPYFLGHPHALEFFLDKDQHIVNKQQLSQLFSSCPPGIE